MEVEFRLAKDDIAALYSHLHGCLPSLKHLYLRMWLLPPALLIVLGLFLYVADKESRFSIVIALAWLIGFPILHRRGIKKSVPKLGHNLGPAGEDDRYRVSIGPKAVIEKSRFLEATVKWPAISRIAQTEDHIFMFQASKTLIVPRRAFSDESEFATFAETARRYHESATATGPS